MTAMPGTRHRGPLQPLGVGDQQLLANLKAHVVAVASEEHNVGHPKRSSVPRVTSKQRSPAWATPSPAREFETEGVKVRNLEVRRTGRVRERRGSSWSGHYDSAQGAVGRMTTARAWRRCSSLHACSNRSSRRGAGDAAGFYVNGGAALVRDGKKW